MANSLFPRVDMYGIAAGKEEHHNWMVLKPGKFCIDAFIHQNVINLWHLHERYPSSLVFYDCTESFIEVFHEHS